MHDIARAHEDALLDALPRGLDDAGHGEVVDLEEHLGQGRLPEIAAELKDFVHRSRRMVRRGGFGGDGRGERDRWHEV
jgi:hypothetical protein